MKWNLCVGKNREDAIWTQFFLSIPDQGYFSSFTMAMWVQLRHLERKILTIYIFYIYTVFHLAETAHGKISLPCRGQIVICISGVQYIDIGGQIDI